MKIDACYMLQIFLIIIYATTIFSYFVYSYKKLTKSITSDMLKLTYKIALSYFKKLSTEDYSVYEKYGIWRFCVLF